MEGSTSPSEVLALGVRIVRELELEPSVDTLGRWLAHHLAEVMLLAKTAEGPARAAAESKAVELILKIWARRHDLPGHSHPLKDFEGVLKIIRLLNNDAWPYPHASRESTERLLEAAFRGLQHIIAHGALLVSERAAAPLDPGETKGFLDQEEKKLIDAMNAWIELYDTAPKHPTIVMALRDETTTEALETEMNELLALDASSRARKIFVKQIDSLIDVLGHLRTRLALEQAS